MRIFLTGATGFIGSAVVKELTGAGHEVLGLTRSDEGAAQLAALGATAHHGSLEDLESIQRGAESSDGVIHLAFNHDFSKYHENCESDRKLIEAIGSVLAGSGRPLIITSGTAMASGAPGQEVREDDAAVSSAVAPRAASEEAAATVAALGVPVSIVRLAQIHDEVKQGLIPYAIDLAREKGISAYVGDGSNRWPAAHVSDVARLYRLALEKGDGGATYHAVAEEGVPMIQICEAIARGLKIPAVSLSPEEAADHFGWLAMFVGRDTPASSAWTREKLGWHPTGPGLIEDLHNMKF